MMDHCCRKGIAAAVADLCSSCSYWLAAVGEVAFLEQTFLLVELYTIFSGRSC